MSSNLLTTFSPNNGAYGTTKTIEPVIVVRANNDNECPLINSRILARRGNAPATSLFGALLNGCRKNCLLSYILGATLLASVFNTILLSFVIKSLQLNDRGFIDGKISWDDRIGGTVFELPTSLRSGKSISLNSIESHKDKPLRFLINQPAASSSISQPDQSETPGRSSVFLSVDTPDKEPSLASESTKPEHISKLNYMALGELNQDDATAVSGGDIFHRRTLEIGTKSLKLNLIDVNTSQRNAHNGSRRLQSPISRLLEFDDESRSISLPLEKELRLNSEQANSISLSSELASDIIVGSHEDSLRVQTGEGNLAIRCRDSLELVSKSASVKLTTLEELSLWSRSVSFSSGQGLYLTNGIEYFDSEFELNQHTLSPAEQRASFPEGRGESEAVAYNLFTVDGILRAEAD